MNFISLISLLAKITCAAALLQVLSCNSFSVAKAPVAPVALLSQAKVSPAQAYARSVAGFIQHKNTSLTREQALRLGSAIYTAAVKGNVKPDLVLAIVAVESNFRVNAINKRSHDYGLMQINAWNVRVRGLNKHKLLTDINYNLEVGVTILSEFKRRYAHKEQTWACRFNTGTGKLVGRLADACTIYYTKIKSNKEVLIAKNF